MSVQYKELKIRRPDDWHIHLRDGDILRTVLPYTSRYFGRAVVMPNLIPPITTLVQAQSYRKHILDELHPNHCFTPLMTCYLTESLNKKTLIDGFLQRIFFSAKLYPANTTTHSQNGVTNITKIYPLFDAMQMMNMPLSVHGEITEKNIDIFDREAIFIEKVMEPIRRHFPVLKIIFEHITTKEAVEYVLANNNVGATVTPHHLMFDRNNMLVGGVRPHLYCLPILKRNVHKKALRAAVASGCSRFFLGTDTAPHSRKNKESDCGCAGIFNAPSALSAYATVFEEMNAIEKLEAFCSLNGPRFYGLSINKDFILLRRKMNRQAAFIPLVNSHNETLVPFLAKKTLDWVVVQG